MNIGNCKEKFLKDEKSQVPILLYFTGSIQLKLQDINGNNLLDPKFTGYYSFADIVVFESDDVNNAVYISKDYPNEDYYLELSLNLPKLKNSNKERFTKETITKIKFGNNKIDNIKGLFEISYNEATNPKGFGTGGGYTIILQKAWLNKILIYDKKEVGNKPNQELPIIIKEANK